MEVELGDITKPEDIISDDVEEASFDTTPFLPDVNDLTPPGMDKKSI